MGEILFSLGFNLPFYWQLREADTPVFRLLGVMLSVALMG